jgi:flagellar hook-length control protein FliK
VPSVASEAATPAFKPSLPNPAWAAQSSDRGQPSPFDALLDAGTEAAAQASQAPPPPTETAQTTPADSPPPAAKSEAKSKTKDGDVAKTASTNTTSKTADANDTDATTTVCAAISTVKAETDAKIDEQTATGDDSKPAADSKPADGMTPAIHTALLANSAAQGIVSAAALIAAAAPIAVPQTISATALQGAVAATENSKGKAVNLSAGKADIDLNTPVKTAPAPQSGGKPQPATSDTELAVAPSHDEVPAAGHHTATAEVPPAVTPDAQTAVPKTFADAVQQAALTAPSQGAAQTAANPAAPAQPASQALAVPLAGVAVEIAGKALEGKNRFEIRLDPPELGRIEVRLDVDHDGNTVTRLIADRPDTLDLLRRDADGLQRSLQDAGLKTSDNSLQFSLRDQTMGRDQGNTPMPAAAQIVVKDDALASTDISPRNYPRLAGLGGGIDIRV